MKTIMKKHLPHIALIAILITAHSSTAQLTPGNNISPEEVMLYSKMMSQRCAFDVSGVVVDDSGIPLDGVTLIISTTQFNPSTMGQTTTKYTTSVDRVFSFASDDLSSITLTASKADYHAAKRMFTYMQQYELKQVEVERAIARKEIKRPQTIKDKYELYKNLKCNETNVTLILNREVN